MKEIAVATGNQNLFTKNNVLYARGENGACTALVYYGEASHVILTDGCRGIQGEAFAGTNVVEVAMPGSVSVLGEQVFCGCNALRRIHFFLSEQENGKHRPVSVYLPTVESEEFYYGNSLREQYMDCIRSGSGDRVFDFEKYDSLFESIEKDYDKVLVATDRLKSPVKLMETYSDNYSRFLRSNKDRAVRVLIREDDAAGLALMASYGGLRPENMDTLIHMANQNKKTNAQLFLMNYKNTMIGFDFSAFEL